MQRGKGAAAAAIAACPLEGLVEVWKRLKGVVVPSNYGQLGIQIRYRRCDDEHPRVIVRGISITLRSEDADSRMFQPRELK